MNDGEERSATCRATSLPVANVWTVELPTSIWTAPVAIAVFWVACVATAGWVVHLGKLSVMPDAGSGADWMASIVARDRTMRPRISVRYAGWTRPGVFDVSTFSSAPVVDVA